MQYRGIIGVVAGAGLQGLIAPGAEAAVVVHDNFDGTFKWTTGMDLPGDDFGELPGALLDITLPASEQTGERRPGTIGQWYIPNQSSSSPARRMFYGEAGVETPLTDDLVRLWWNEHWISVKVSREYLSGESISGQAHWNRASEYFFHLPFSDSLSQGTPAISDLAYIGVRVKIANRWHYGWILFAEYDIALQWAFETEPDVPIQVPVPAPSAGILMMAGACFLTHRRRRN
jgi:hypothetical protein